MPAGGWGRRLVIHRVGAVSYALPPFLDLLGRVNRSPSRFKWNFVRLWKSMKPRVYENPHEGGTRDPRRDHVRIPKEIVLIPEPPFTFAAHSAPFCFGNPNSYNAPRSRCGAKSGLAALGNGKTARESARQIPACSRLSQEPKACWRSGSADPTAPEQVWQAPGLREFRLAESQQILPPTGNRKPATNRPNRERRLGGAVGPGAGTLAT